MQTPQTTPTRETRVPGPRLVEVRPVTILSNKQSARVQSKRSVVMTRHTWLIGSSPCQKPS